MKSALQLKKMFLKSYKTGRNKTKAIERRSLKNCFVTLRSTGFGIA